MKSASLLVLACLLPTVAVAQEESTSPPVRYQERTEITFDGMDLTGERLTPLIASTTERPAATFPVLFPVRTSFDAEMLGSVASME